MAIEVSLNFLYQLIGQKTVEAAVAAEQAGQLAVELEELRKQLAELRAAEQPPAAAESSSGPG